MGGHHLNLLMLVWRSYLVHAQRRARRDEGIHTDVKLESVQQQGPTQVHLRHLLCEECWTKAETCKC